MAFIGLKVPHETARLLSEIEVDGDKQSPSSYHITLLYIGSNVPIETLAKAVVATFGVTSKTRPFTVSTNQVTHFPGNEDGVPIICKVDSDPLHDFRAKLAAAFDEAGIEYSKRFNIYRPHVTLSYAKEGIEDRRIPKLEWGAHEIILWGGDSGDNRLVTHFPLTLEVDTAKIAKRVIQRFSRLEPLEVEAFKWDGLIQGIEVGF